jgi:hypothetical protein
MTSKLYKLRPVVPGETHLRVLSLRPREAGRSVRSIMGWTLKIRFKPIGGEPVVGSFTTEHAASSYGQPVLVGPDGTPYGKSDVEWVDTAEGGRDLVRSFGYPVRELRRFRVTNQASGLDFGIFEAEDEADAIRAMYRDAGYTGPDDPRLEGVGGRDEIEAKEVEDA